MFPYSLCLQHLSGPFATLNGMYELAKEEEEPPDPNCANGCIYRKIEETPGSGATDDPADEFCFKVDKANVSSIRKNWQNDNYRRSFQEATRSLPHLQVRHLSVVKI